MTKKYQNLSPFADWFVKLAEARDITITALAHQAGLAPGTLRYLVIEPERKPTIETCLRLSAISSRPVAELLALAGQTSSSQPIDPYHPDRLKIVSMFDALSPLGRSALLKVALLFNDVAQKNSHESEKRGS